MQIPGMIILYVADPLASATFYKTLLDRKADEASPGFVMFHLHERLSLGLWRRDAVVPAAGTAGHELVVLVGDAASVDTANWDAPILQPPATAEFGHSLVAADPDGHRIRLLAPA